MSLITPDFGLLVWMTLIFGIVFFVLAKWGFPMITDSVRQRADRINESIKQAKEAEEKLRNLASEQAAIIEETKKEQTRINQMLSTLETGDSVLTTSGFYGVVIDVSEDDDTIIVEFGSNKNCRIPMKKEAIAQIEKPESATAAPIEEKKDSKKDKKEKN